METEKKEFEIGDVVELKSGGPKMTVYEVINNGKHLKCCYFDGSRYVELMHALDSKIIQLAPEDKKTI